MHTTAVDLDQLAQRTARYARYSLSAGGLSSVLGGILLFVAFTLNAFADLGPLLRSVLAATPAIWLIAKEVLRRRYYQRDGAVLQTPSTKERRQHFWMVVYLAAVALVVLGFMVAAIVRDQALPDGPIIGYILVVVAMPVAAWRWFWSVSDFLVGVLLFCQSAVVIAGSNYPATWLWYIAACAGVAVFYGWREHRDYLALRAELADGRVER
jgi:hypothetical protein